MHSPKTLKTLATALTLAAVLAGCGATPTGAARRVGAGLAARTANEAPALATPRFHPVDADVHYDTDTYEAMYRIVAGARRAIKLDYYVFGGPVAQKLTDTLIAKHRAGVEVRVLLDAGLGQLPELRAECQAVIGRLKEAGVPLRFHARTPIPPRAKGETIDHNKYFVVDDAEVLVGSMNLATKFYGFHDVMIRARGPVAADLARQHDHDWFYADKPGAAPAELVHLDPAPAPVTEGAQARIVGTGLGRKTGLEALLPLLAGAGRSIHVQMHELGPGPALDALVAARDRGVDVKVLLDPGNVDAMVPVIGWAPKGVINAVAVDRLLAAKLEVRLFKIDPVVTTAHMKLAVVDGETVFAGSTNWTRGGFEAVSETNIEVRGGRAPGQAEARFTADWMDRSVPAMQPSKLALKLCRIYHGMGE